MEVVKTSCGCYLTIVAMLIVDRYSFEQSKGRPDGRPLTLFRFSGSFYFSRLGFLEDIFHDEARDNDTHRDQNPRLIGGKLLHDEDNQCR